MSSFGNLRRSRIDKDDQEKPTGELRLTSSEREKISQDQRQTLQTRKETEVEARGEKEKEEKKKKKKIKTKYSEAGIVTTQRSDERWRFEGTREAGPQRGEQRPSQPRWGGKGKRKG